MQETNRTDARRQKAKMVGERGRGVWQSKKSGGRGRRFSLLPLFQSGEARSAAGTTALLPLPGGPAEGWGTYTQLLSPPQVPAGADQLASHLPELFLECRIWVRKREGSGGSGSTGSWEAASSEWVGSTVFCHSQLRGAVPA